MKKLLLCLSLLFFIPNIFANDEHDEVAAALNWLAVIDSGRYVQSWHQSSPLFQKQASKQQWDTTARRLRASLGQVVSRESNGVKYLATLPGAPEGEYAILTFATQFKNKSGAIETIVMSKEDAKWLTVGYFVN